MTRGAHLGTALFLALIMWRVVCEGVPVHVFGAKTRADTRMIKGATYHDFPGNLTKTELTHAFAQTLLASCADSSFALIVEDDAIPLQHWREGVEALTASMGEQTVWIKLFNS